MHRLWGKGRPCRRQPLAFCLRLLSRAWQPQSLPGAFLTPWAMPSPHRYPHPVPASGSRSIYKRRAINNASKSEETRPLLFFFFLGHVVEGLHILFVIEITAILIVRVVE